MSRYDGIEDASSSKVRRYLTPGKYVLEIEKVTDGTTRKGKDFFAVDLSVLESSSEDFAEGDSVSWFVTITGVDSAMGNIRSFLEAALCCDDVTGDTVEEALSEEQPLTGITLRAEALNVLTRAGNDFTAVNWSKR